MRAIRENFFQAEIAEASFRYQQEVERGERRIVGVNAYTEGEEVLPPLHRIDPDLERAQCARVQAYRACARRRRDRGEPGPPARRRRGRRAT